MTHTHTDKTGNDHQQVENHQLIRRRARRVNQRSNVHQNERRGDDELDIGDPREALAVRQSHVAEALVQAPAHRRRQNKQTGGM